MHVDCEIDRALQPPQGGNVVLAVDCSQPAGAGEAAPGLTIAAVVDRSASMKGGTKFQSAKDALRALVAKLGPRDRLVLIAFDRDAQVLAAGPVVSAAPFLTAIDALECRSGTNIGLALETAGRYLAADESGNPRRILLLTDGEASVGELSRPRLAQRSREHAQQEIVTTCLGFGVEYDEDTLSAIALEGGGRLHHVEEASELGAVFASELGRLRALAARSIALTVTSAGGARILGSRNPYLVERRADSVLLRISDLSGGEAKCILFDVLVPPRPTAQTGEHVVASVRVEWEDAAGESHHEDRAVAVTYTDEATAAAAEPNGGVLLQMALLDAALAKERAVADSDKGNYISGSVRLAHSLRLLQGTARMGDPRIDQEVARLQDLVDKMRQGKLDRSARKELRAEIHTARIGTATAARLNLDVGDGPPAV